MTDATAYRTIEERFGADSLGYKIERPTCGTADRCSIKVLDRIASSWRTIGQGPTWEHAINEALAWKAAQR